MEENNAGSTKKVPVEILQDAVVRPVEVNCDAAASQMELAQQVVVEYDVKVLPVAVVLLVVVGLLEEVRSSYFYSVVRDVPARGRAGSND